MSSPIGFIGSGAIGANLARLAVAAGYDVLLSNSRGPETLADLVTELGDHARAATPAEVAQASDIVVAAVQFRFHDKLPADALAGKIVIDTMNYFPEFDGIFTELDERRLTSSELVQRHLRHSRVVKALNNLDSVRLYTTARPAGHPQRSTLAITGDDAVAKQQVAQFMTAIGYDPLDIGTLAESWKHEAGTPVNVLPYIPPLPKGLTLEEHRKWWLTAPGAHITADKVKELTSQAVRTGRVGGSSADWGTIYPGF
ncbi:NAD(P)-binding domain-containing protein [Ralstonia pseudosolanacearum]|uniref:NADPH-dependent F420 reductase n=1 Tax=Ralstonia pseudosolanacearum TaxID=1310165 RepID=UPI0020065CDF|nr:NAD(P)-binding domain-containing protein [Ralstonia pseudosolanacearum]MCK4141941.1 NAD(P)-binding domain-containing protein [Ralstonia pseudosolanacearum]